jgi:hypothetical protein
MKIYLVLLSVLFLFGIFFLVFKNQPKLIAVSDLQGKITLWENTSKENQKLIEDVFSLTKDLIPKTLELRQKSRNNEYRGAAISVYYIIDGEWMYVFADNYPYILPGMDLINDKKLINSIHFHISSKKFLLKQL